MSRGWIGVDLDGTLAHYEDWVHETHVGEPISRMVARVKRWRADGIEVRVLTARVSHPESNDACVKSIETWCLEHVGEVLPITCIKDFQMIELWDDRVVQVEPNTGRIIGRSTRGFTEPEHIADDGSVRKSHYGAGRQPWDDIRDIGWGPAFAAGNALKYVRRAANKNGDDDIAKGRWYYDQLNQLAIGDDPGAIHAVAALNDLDEMLTSEERAMLQEGLTV